MHNESKPPGTRALRRGRHSQPGGIYLITTTTISRAPLFNDFWRARAAIMAMNHPASLGDARLLAWVLMPDHLHLLLQVGVDDLLSMVVGRIKSRSATAANRSSMQSAGVWSKGYHDRALRQVDDIRATARYIVANPVRAGLVRRCGDYPFWDAAWLV